MNDDRDPMRDPTGVATEVRGVVQAYLHGGRRSGRTTRMIDALKDGDRVVCADPRNAKHIEAHARTLGRRIEVIVVPPSDPGRLLQRPPSEGRTLFDHTFAEAVVLKAIDDAGSMLYELADLDSRRSLERPIVFSKSFIP